MSPALQRHVFGNLKRKTHGDHSGVIVCMEVSQRNLLTASESQAQTAGLSIGVVRQRNATDDEAGRYKCAGLAIVLAAFVKSRVEFHLRPEEARKPAFCYTILSGVIPDNAVAQTL